MKFTLDKQEKYTLFKLEEDKLNSTISPQLKTELVTLYAEGVVNLILNLSATGYADSSGLSAILAGNRVFSENDGTFVLTGINSFVEKLITISQLDSILNILKTDEEAIDLIFMNELEKGFKAEDTEE